MRSDTFGRKTLFLSHNIKEGGTLGRSSAVAQFIVTWAHSSSSPCIRTYVDNRTENEKLTENIYTVAAIFLAQEVFPRKTERNLRDELLSATQERIKNMYIGNLKSLVRGRRIEFIFLEGNANEFHIPLYVEMPKRSDLLNRQRHGDMVNNPSRMNSFIDKCLQAIEIRGAAEGTVFLQKYLHTPKQPLGRFLYESFRNTAEHAYLSDDGKFTGNSLRAITIALRPSSPDQFAETSILSANHKNEKKYLETILDKFREKGQRQLIGMLEISILDSGPGFARTIEGKNKTNSSDHDLVAKCFHKNISAKHNSSAGLGLSRILEVVRDLNGYLRVRTATTEFFLPGTDPLNFDQFDAKRHIQSGLPKIRGTLLTACFPLLY